MESPQEQQPGTQPEAPKSGMKRPAVVRNLLIGVVIGIAVIAAVVLAVFALGVYKLGWHGKASMVFLEAVPYPALSVNNHLLRYSDYLDDVQTLTKFLEKQKATADAESLAQYPDDEQIRQSVLDRLVYEEVLREEAEAHGVTPTSADVDAEYGKIATESGGEKALEAQIFDLYGWNTARFKKKVVETYLLEQHLEAELQKDPELAMASESRANEALAKAKDGSDFAALAQEYSDDTGSGSQGGELGWFGKGVMVKEFEDAAFSMEAGQVSDLVKTQFGYHIIKVEEVKKEGGEVTEVRASHILIGGPDLQTYLDGKIQAASVKKYIKI